MRTSSPKCTRRKFGRDISPTIRCREKEVTSRLFLDYPTFSTLPLYALPPSTLPYPTLRYSTPHLALFVANLLDPTLTLSLTVTLPTGDVIWHRMLRHGAGRDSKELLQDLERP